MYLVNQESTRRGNRKKKQGQTKTGLEPTRKTGFETDNGVEMAILFSPDEPDACSTTRNKQRQKPILKKKNEKKRRPPSAPVDPAALRELKWNAEAPLR